LFGLSVDLVVDIAGIAGRALHELAVAAGIGGVPVLRVLGSSGRQWRPSKCRVEA
jgi:hypothetical protein